MDNNITPGTWLVLIAVSLLLWWGIWEAVTWIF